MKREYTIAQLARAAAVPNSTLRYYERARLLLPEGRSPGNYRLYSGESLRRLKFIRAAQAAGFTLNDVRKLLGEQSGNAPSCRDVQTLIEKRLSDVRQRLCDLRRVERALSSSLRKCKRSAQPPSCRLIAALSRDQGVLRFDQPADYDSALR
jgi:DNA-binding transcriptional MerR regulator